MTLPIVIPWTLAVLAEGGVVLNLFKRRGCFAVWIVTNAAWMVITLAVSQGWIHHTAALPLAPMYGLNLGLAVWGWSKWKPKEVK